MALQGQQGIHPCDVLRMVVMVVMVEPARLIICNCLRNQHLFVFCLFSVVSNWRLSALIWRHLASRFAYLRTLDGLCQYAWLLHP